MGFVWFMVGALFGMFIMGLMTAAHDDNDKDER